ncbi:hypothetical protein [Fodinicola acaciae]|uniref:hypothetical protein n=1 Tax=Fodinicola acaciae TaxID=2681555 RepID=UPI0013D1C921|nr:hypothetical protein [Fodinicola acaciae]
MAANLGGPRHPGPPRRPVPPPYGHIPHQRRPAPPYYPRPYYPHPPRPPQPRRGIGRTLLWTTLWITGLAAALVGGYFGTLLLLS